MPMPTLPVLSILILSVNKYESAAAIINDKYPPLLAAPNLPEIAASGSSVVPV